jgi:hypothetical protein
LKDFEVAPSARRDEIGRYGTVWSRTRLLDKRCRSVVGRSAEWVSVSGLSPMILSECSDGVVDGVYCNVAEVEESHSTMEH